LTPGTYALYSVVVRAIPPDPPRSYRMSLAVFALLLMAVWAATAAFLWGDL